MKYVFQKKLGGDKVGVVFGCFAPLHQGHLDLIMRAKKENEGGCLVIVCGYKNDRGGDLIPADKRYRYVREYFAKDDLVSVYMIDEDELGIAGKDSEWDIWLSEFNNIWNIAIYNDFGDTKRTWYVGEEDYKKELEKRGEKVVLMNRNENYISATMIRSNPVKYWNKIALPFRRIFSHNILITGTASEGKSTLTADLGNYFNAPYSHEWAIDYIQDSCLAEWELDGTDYMAFIEGQYALNKSLINSNANQGIFFSDTDSIVTKMYAEYYSKDDAFAITPEEYKKVAEFADEFTKKSRWDKVFLLPPKGVFVDNGIRYMEHSAMEIRYELYNILCKELKKAGLWDKVTILDGGYYHNFITVVNYVKGIIENGKN